MTEQNPEGTVTDTKFAADLAKLLDGAFGDAPNEDEAHATARVPRCAHDPIFDPDNQEKDRALIEFLSSMVHVIGHYLNAPAPLRRLNSMSAHQAFHDAENPEEKLAAQRSALLYQLLELEFFGRQD